MKIRRIVLKVCLAGFALAGIFICGGFGLVRMAEAPPEYYARIIAAETESDIQARHDVVKDLVGDVVQMRNDIANDPEWTLRLTDGAINAWLAENTLSELVEDLPPELSQPRLRFETESLLLAFRWAAKPFDAVISVRLKPSCVSPNELKIGFESVNIGLLPIFGKRFRQEVLDSLSAFDQDARWTVEDDLPTLHVKITPGLQSKSVELEKITVLDGEIRVTGKSRDAIARKLQDPLVR